MNNAQLIRKPLRTFRVELGRQWLYGSAPFGKWQTQTLIAGLSINDIVAPWLIKGAFSKLKAHLQRIGARTIEQLFDAIGEICNLFSPEECQNYLKAAGYEPD